MPSRPASSRHVIQGIAWTLSGSGAQVAFQLIVTATLARLLTPADFGIVGMALAVAGFSQIFAQLGVGSAIVQSDRLTDEQLAAARGWSSMFGFGCTLLLWLIAIPLERGTGIADIGQTLRWLSTMFVVQGFGVVAEALMQRRLQFRSLAYVNAISYALGYGALGVACAMLRMEHWSLVIANLGMVALRTILLIVWSRDPLVFRLRATGFGQLVRFGGGVTVGNIAGYVAGQGDNFIVGKVLGAAALGIYGRAYKIMSFPAQVFAQAIDKVVFPSLAAVQHSREKLRTAHRRGTFLTATLVLPASVLAYVLAPEIVSILLGRQWTAAIFPLQLVSLGMFFRVALKIGDILARATGAVRAIALSKTIYAALVLGLSWWGSQYDVALAALGVSVALTGAYVVFSYIGMQASGLSATSLVIAHVPGTAAATLIFLVITPVASALRGGDAPAIVTLAVTAATAAAVMAVALYFGTIGIKSDDWSWWAQKLREAFLHRRPGIIPD